ncbi:hypothetical protein M758_4G026500 [Ceratodon purpureus]|nr:hypothetical protein M758_4G026500 [Ceratodon purpureus]
MPSPSMLLALIVIVVLLVLGACFGKARAFIRVRVNVRYSNVTQTFTNGRFYLSDLPDLLPVEEN